MSFFRDEVQQLPAYIAGKASANPDVIKVASNEMPGPSLPKVVAALTQNLENLGQYPDFSVKDLRKAIAQFHGVSETQVLPANGSVTLIEKILCAICGADSEVIIPWRSFEAYPIAVQMAGAATIKVPLNSKGAPDLGAMLDAVTLQTKAILICSPNNPTSAAVTQKSFVNFLRHVPQDVLVIADEAYFEFVQMEDQLNAIKLVSEFSNLVVLRTFSKAYSLAGLRLGYAVAQAEIISGLQKISTPFGVSALAQSAGVAALDDIAEVERRVAEICRERESLVAALKLQGWCGPVPQGNFIWFPLGSHSQIFSKICEEHGITVRAYGADGVRVTVATPEASLRLIRAYSQFRHEFPELVGGK
ncbi:MAG: histidinol-phosphate transaminase [Arcanobacterium sp.]|nr:histidinol-phosphate transaminase [Arcanobacterium sp.]